MANAKTLFKKHFAFAPPYVVLAPGRLELLGNHTDYNQGLVMSLAVDRYLAMASSPRTDGKIELVSSAFPDREKFSLSDIRKNPAAPWADYVKGVLLQLRQRGVYFGGFNAAIHSAIPIGAGLSSSAALEVVAALTVRQLHPYTVTDTGVRRPPPRDAHGNPPALTAKEKLSLAKLCLAAENQFVGVNCGLLDQISSLFGKAGHVILIDCQHVTVELIPLPAAVAIVVCDSGVKHALVSGEYNQRRRYCEAAARALGVRSLRAVELRQLPANRSKLTERQYQCAYHIVGENRRVIAGERVLRSGDLEQFGQFLFQSHESSRDFFKNSCPELDLLVALARAQPACFGARLTGGGFGGATLNLVAPAQARNFMEIMTVCYAKRAGRKLEPLLCQIVDGAR
ncbi:MAG: galactokinase [Limisphaerales bacterium]